MFKVVSLLPNQPLPKDNRPVRATNGGGPGIMTTDATSQYSLFLPVKNIPQSLYHDHYSVFLVNDEKTSSIENELTGKRPLTQFGRLLEELGIISIAANSPEAKGRIEIVGDFSGPASE